MIYKKLYRKLKIEQHKSHTNWGEFRCSERVISRIKNIFSIYRSRSGNSKNQNKIVSRIIVQFTLQ
jgi:hypothetical protein